MKFTLALSTLLFVLPSLVSAALPVDGRSLENVNHLPQRNRAARRNHSVFARQNGRGRQRQRQGGGRGQRQQQQAQQQAAQQAAAEQAAAEQAAAEQAAAEQAAADQGAADQVAADQAAADQAAADQAAAEQAAAQQQQGGRGRNRNQNQNQNNQAAQQAAADQAAAEAAAASASAAAAAAAASEAAVAAEGDQAATGNDNQNQNQDQNQNQNNNNNNQNNNQDPQESLTLLAELVAPGLAQDGQAVAEEGQVPSLTSTNNFVNFCAGKTITNGLQIADGSCNPVPMGDIIPQNNMPSCKFTFPENFSTIPANTPFTAQLAVTNMRTGFFTNAQKTYYSAPQQVDGGTLVAHSHVVIQEMGAFDSPNILDPLDFAFFKGLNDPAQNGILSAELVDGLPAGNYRMASINTNANHAPAIVAVAQHGFLDDMVYFTVQ